MVIVMALGFVLVSPYVDADDAVHHRAHQHDLSWSVEQAGPALVVTNNNNSSASANEMPASLFCSPRLLHCVADAPLSTYCFLFFKSILIPGAGASLRSRKSRLERT